MFTLLFVCELHRQLFSMMQINDGLEWPPILIFVCDELETYGMWPELQEVQKVYPAPVLPQSQPNLPGSTFWQVLDTNSRVGGAREAFMGATAAWVREQDDNRWQSQLKWDADHLLQQQLRNKP